MVWKIFWGIFWRIFWRGKGLVKRDLAQTFWVFPLPRGRLSSFFSFLFSLHVQIDSEERSQRGFILHKIHSFINSFGIFSVFSFFWCLVGLSVPVPSPLSFSQLPYLSQFPSSQFLILITCAWFQNYLLIDVLVTFFFLSTFSSFPFSLVICRLSLSFLPSLFSSPFLLLFLLLFLLFPSLRAISKVLFFYYYYYIKWLLNWEIFLFLLESSFPAFSSFPSLLPQTLIGLV